MARAEVKNNWSTRKFKASDGTLLEYFTEQKSVAKYFTPSMDNYEVNYYIIKQMRLQAREVLAVVDYTDTERITQALMRIDSARKETVENKPVGQAISQRPNPQNYHPNNYQPNNYHPNTSSRQRPAINYIQETRPLHSTRTWNKNRRPNGNSNTSRERSAILENRRERDSGDSSVHFTLPGTSKPPPAVIPLESTQTSMQSQPTPTHLIQAIERSEFLNGFSWDVEKNHGLRDEIIDAARVISPRVRADIYSHEYNILLDSGSGVTCVSEFVYDNLKRNNQLPELPVTNLAVHVAAGRKMIKITRKTFIKFKIWKLELEHAFLVIPGLSTDFIGGDDFFKTYGRILDFKNETFEISNETILKEFVTFQSVPQNSASACYSLKLVAVKSTQMTRNENYFVNQPENGRCVCGTDQPR